MPGITRTRRQRRAAILARERDLAAWHEAGHAVAYVLGGLPLHDARIWKESNGRGWAGRVRPTPVGIECEVPEEKLTAVAVAALAGPEAEAQRIHQTSGGRLSSIRNWVEAHNDVPGGDFDGLPELLTLAGITLTEADRIATDMVAAWWPQITRVEDIRTPPGA
jgi:hypothetical protein